MNIKDKLVIFFATGFYVGNIPFAPGTFGTALGLLFCYLLSLISLHAAAGCILLFILFSIWIAHHAEKIVGQKDPGRIVIDEISGVMVTMAGLEFTAASAIGGFFIFRFFDILKPFPIRTVERKVPGGAGVVLDDVIAGVMSNVVLRVFLVLVN